MKRISRFEKEINNEYKMLQEITYIVSICCVAFEINDSQHEINTCL